MALLSFVRRALKEITKNVDVLEELFLIRVELILVSVSLREIGHFF